MDQLKTYRCDGCGTEYHVAGTAQPTVLCPDCKQVATPRGDPAARREYQVGYAKYTEARRQLTEALERFDEGDTALARGHFNDAATEFEDSVDNFTTASKQAAGDGVQDMTEQARKKATCLWQAAEWLSGATYAREQDAREQASQYRNDARQRLQAAREYGTLRDPSEIDA